MEENLKQIQSDVLKITLFGPECTGKTTLSEQLASEFNTLWVPEFAREYLQKKWETKQEICAEDDLLPIAIGQINLENEAITKANAILFCDTNSLVTKVFSDIYYHTCSTILEKAAKKHKYDLFFLTDVDVPWEKDDLRDLPENREHTFSIFENALQHYKKPYIKLSGNAVERKQKAVTIVSDLIKAKKLGFTSQDYVEMYQKNIDIATIENQINFVKKGITKTVLDRPAIINDGILSLSKEESVFFSNYFDENKNALKLKKFVPASGAASRMFKFLSEFINEFKLGEESINAYINRTNDKNLPVFLVAKEKFPFHAEVIRKIKALHSDYDNLDKDTRDYWFIHTLLSKDAFDYANKPKGVLPFHKYKHHIATAIEEHLNECAFYASTRGKSHIHFTVSKEHLSGFQSIVKKVKSVIEEKTKVSIDVNYSFQNESTDVIALNTENQPFRDQNDMIVFRPGGHGALIENLNNLDADLVFIKNIDNVIQNHIEEITLYKKALGGILLKFQKEIFDYLRILHQDNVSKEIIEEITFFIKEKLNIDVQEDFNKYTKESKIENLIAVLNRPIRICGIVKNEGEPGGGPFWVKDNKGRSFLQIIESTQIDFKDEQQAKIAQNATHFNPVDLVCGIKNYCGKPFDLNEYIDVNSGFIVEKNKNGKTYKAYELPGLWNGAMAKWLTLFVEVPLITFNPVKTVNDLLKPAHQPES
jgi:nicotinamide riboside kinase